MSHWTKGKFRQREPPPAVFVQGSPTTSKVSLSGNVGAVGGPGSGSGSGGGAGVSGGAAMSSGGSGGVLSPVMPTLQRTTSRLRQEVAGSTVPPTTTSSGGIVSEGGGGAGSSGGAGGPGSPPMTAAAAASAASANNTYSLPLPLPLRRPSSSRATDRADSLWAEMQATLEEVELSASEGTRVFGPDHDGKLAELRQAQIALAQAWARSEADDAIETTLSSAAAAATAAETARTGTTSGGTGTGAGTAPGTATGAATGTAPGTAEGEQLHATISNLAKTTTTGTTPLGARDDVSGTAGADGSTAGTATASAAAPPGSSVSAAAVARMEAEETQVDILLARKRREANDRYFQRVGRGVLDVVAKLDDVAVAMRAVEQESKDMFGDNGVEEEDEGEA